MGLKSESLRLAEISRPGFSQEPSSPELGSDAALRKPLERAEQTFGLLVLPGIGPKP